MELRHHYEHNYRFARSGLLTGQIDLVAQRDALEAEWTKPELRLEACGFGRRARACTRNGRSSDRFDEFEIDAPDANRAEGNVRLP